LEVPWVMCLFGASHPSAQSSRMDPKWAPNALAMHSDRPPVPKRLADVPRRGWGLLGAESRGFGLGVLGN
jgi:hypothetical protein